MRKHGIIISATIGATLLCGLFVIDLNKTKSEKIDEPPSAPVAIVQPRKSAPIESLKPTPVISIPKPEVEIADSDLKAVTIHLNEFQTVNKKILKSEDDKVSFSKMVKDRKMLRLAQRLLLKSKGVERKLHDGALTLLIEGLKIQDDYSRSLSAQIIADAGIEDVQKPQAERQLQAELKAELIYQWSSMDPNAASHIRSILPGPVSERLWQNILSHQANNEAESQTVQ